MALLDLFRDGSRPSVRHQDGEWTISDTLSNWCSLEKTRTLKSLVRVSVHLPNLTNKRAPISDIDEISQKQPIFSSCFNSTKTQGEFFSALWPKINKHPLVDPRERRRQASPVSTFSVLDHTRVYLVLGVVRFPLISRGHFNVLRQQRHPYLSTPRVLSTISLLSQGRTTRAHTDGFISCIIYWKPSSLSLIPVVPVQARRGRRCGNLN